MEVADILLALLICLFLYKPLLWLVKKVIRQVKNLGKDINKGA